MEAKCNFDQQIEAYHDGQLPAEQRTAVERHLTECAACATRLEELAAISAMFAAATGPQLSQIGRHRLHRAVASEMDRGLVRLAGALSGIAAGIVLIGSIGLLHVQNAAAVPQSAPPWVGVNASADTETLAQQAGTPTAVWYLADASQNEGSADR